MAEMKKEHFERLCAILKSAFPRIEFLDNADSTRVFFNMMNRFDIDDVWQGVKNYIETQHYAPAIADLVHYTEEAERIRKEALRRKSAAEIMSLTVKCPKCNDAGFVWVTYPGNVEVCRICTCEKARQDSPWAFMTEDQFEEENEKLRKRGQNPPLGKPGHDTAWWEQEFGIPESITPGKRAPGERAVRK